MIFLGTLYHRIRFLHFFLYQIMQQRAKENKQMLKFDEKNNQKHSSSYEQDHELEQLKIQIKKSQNQWRIRESSFEISISLDQEQIITDNYSDMVSLEQNLMKQHLGYLQMIVWRIDKKLFKICYDFNGIQSNKVIYHQYEDSIQQYLKAGKSLLTYLEIQFFIRFMHENLNFKKALDWIYLNVQPQLGDELILVAYKIVQAYLPVKVGLTNMQIITILAQHPYNIQYVYLDPRLKLLNFTKLYEVRQGVFQFQQHIYQFYQEFLRTILFVLEQYFHNPGYADTQTINQMSQKELNQSDLITKTKKKKKILKNSRMH